ncbi:MAG: AAA family ATPase [Bacteriovoracaceae bacterium]|jgi:chromosome partitioning protein|nr:AAA family ATPase [Bacteriovoracaceae bacterium]
MAKIISLLNKKGGVGKTTTTVHIASRLADMGYKTLIIDADVSQGNATLHLMGEIWNAKEHTPGLGSVFIEGRPLNKVIYNTDRENLFIIPSEKFNKMGESYNLDMILSNFGPKGYFSFKKLIEKSGLSEKLDYILFDLPPSLGLSVSAALIASDYVLIPFKVDDFSKNAVVDTVKTVLEIKEDYNEKLEILGAFVSQNDRRNRTNNKMIEEARVLFKEAGTEILEAMIPVYNKMTVLPRERKTVFDIKGAKVESINSYIDLTDEILEKINTHQGSMISGKRTEITLGAR